MSRRVLRPDDWGRSPEQAWEWATEQRELHPRSGLVAQLVSSADAQPQMPSVVTCERRRRSKRKHPRHGRGRDASTSPAPGLDPLQWETHDSSLWVSFFIGARMQS
ncbi:hypothetical protein NDU88_006441 [Pleurodeles waltl]|uniref:Uncharacterized protein n=1 Tax=Pleurodeles waltl TaxID=8319 RepID=A0AAV7MHG4_PLEWA|nr:hypothetical protein NDU88_006441 [Pleurodeles waltl]